MRARDLLRPNPGGLYCAPGDFFIDPVRPVARALITHGHSDHARSGHGSVLATRQTLDIMGLRYGDGFRRLHAGGGLGETLYLDGVNVTFHPAGHVLGSAQICVEHDGTRIVASGDYKRQPDADLRALRADPCDVFITEATFGLPVFRHPPDTHEIGSFKSTEQFPERAHLVGAYALGKAQRVIRLLRDAGYDSRSTSTERWRSSANITRAQGVNLGDLGRRPLTVARKDAFAGAIVVGPPSAFVDRWARRFPTRRLLRIGLDAHQAARQAARRRTAADHLRPFRLGRADSRPSSRPAPAKSG